MTPPIKSLPATGASSCTDLSPVDLFVFQQLPKLGELPESSKSDPDVLAVYQQLASLTWIDLQFGNKDGKLDAKEIDQFLKRNPSKDHRTGSCEVLNQARLFATQVPELKKELLLGPDLSPVDLGPFYSLPDFSKFLALPEAVDPDHIREEIKKSEISPEVKKILMDNSSGILERYLNAKYFVQADLDKDGKISLQDLNRLIQMNASTADIKINPAALLAEARELAPQTALLGFGLRRQYGLKNDKDQIDVFSILGLAQIDPSFLEGDPRLNGLFQMMVEKNAKGELQPRPEAADGVITREEFVKSPLMGEIKKKLGVSTEEALFAKMKDLEAILHHPPFLWPKELKDRLKALGEKEREAILQGYPLPNDQRRAELIVHWLEVTSQTKEEQDKLDHAGPSGNSWLMRLVGHVIYGKSWNDHFQKTRPQERRTERDLAIETLKQTLRDRRLMKVEDAIAYMEANGQGESVKILKEKCDLDRWIRIGNIEDDRERYRGLQQAAKDYRVGHAVFNSENLWDFSILPLPRLGKGGFFERASHLSNWTWSTSPEPLMTLAIDNFLAMKTPNNGELIYKPGTSALLQQLSEEDRKIFEDTNKKTEKGEATDGKKIEEILSKSPLSAAGQETLRKHFKNALITGGNAKVIQEFSKEGFVQKWISEKNQEKLGQIDTFFSLMAAGEASEGEKVTLEKLEGNLQSLGLAEGELKTLKNTLGKIQPAQKVEEPNGLETLFREAALNDKEARARTLFFKPERSEAEVKEFEGIVQASRLSDENKALIVAAFGLQPLHQEIAEAAQEEFYAVTGFPKVLDPEKRMIDPRYAGNLHRSMSVTAQKGVGVWILAAPFLAGGGVGHALTKTKPRNAALGGAALGGFIGYQLADASDPWWIKAGKTGTGAGIGATAAWGFSKLFNLKKGAGSPLLGAAILGISSGVAVNFSKFGKDWRTMGVEALSTPYRPWSDFAVADLPYEGLNIYMDFYLGSKAMEGILSGAQNIGNLRLVKHLRNNPIASTLTPAAIGGTVSYSMTPSEAKTSEKITNTLLGAGTGVGFRYSFRKGWIGIGSAAGTGGAIGYMSSSKDADGSTRALNVLKGAGVGIVASRAVSFFKNRAPGMTEVEAIKGTDGWINKWAKKQYELIVGTEGKVGRLARLKARPGVDPKEVEILEDLAEAYQTLGKAEKNRSVAAQFLQVAEKKALDGKTLRGKSGAELLKGRALEEQSEMILLSGAREYQSLTKTTQTNQTLSKLLLVGVVGNKVDAKMNPNKSQIPAFSTDFEGDPRAQDKPLP